MTPVVCRAVVMSAVALIVARSRCLRSALYHGLGKRVEDDFSGQWHANRLNGSPMKPRTRLGTESRIQIRLNSKEAVGKRPEGRNVYG
jgi:hypothetical protein